jgi:hypothetical protein
LAPTRFNILSIQSIGRNRHLTTSISDDYDEFAVGLGSSLSTPFLRRLIHQHFLNSLEFLVVFEANRDFPAPSGSRFYFDFCPQSPLQVLLQGRNLTGSGSLLGRFSSSYDI